jgi:WD40 repeat protein
MNKILTLALAVLLCVSSSAPSGFAFEPASGFVKLCVPSPDGKRIATTQMDYPVRIWDVETGKEIQKISVESAYKYREGNDDSYFDVEYLAFFPDGKKIAIARYEFDTSRTLATYFIDIWDIESGKKVQTLKGNVGGSGWGNRFSRLVFSSDGKKIVALTHGSIINMWDAESGEVLQKLEKTDKFVNSHNLSPDGTKVITKYWLNDDKTAQILDVESKKSLVELRGHTDRFVSAAFSPDGKKVITGGRDGDSRDRITRIWDAESGKELMQLKDDEADISPTQFAPFSPDGKKIMTSFYSRERFNSGICIWDAESGKMLQKIVTVTDNRVVFLSPCVFLASFFPDGKRIMTTYGADMRIWDAETGKEVRKVVLQGLYRERGE